MPQGVNHAPSTMLAKPSSLESMAKGNVRCESAHRGRGRSMLMISASGIAVEPRRIAVATKMKPQAEAPDE